MTVMKVDVTQMDIARKQIRCLSEFLIALALLPLGVIFV